MPISLKPFDRFWCFNFWLRALNVNCFHSRLIAGQSDPYSRRKTAAAGSCGQPCLPVTMLITYLHRQTGRKWCIRAHHASYTDGLKMDINCDREKYIFKYILVINCWTITLFFITRNGQNLPGISCVVYVTLDICTLLGFSQQMTYDRTEKLAQKSGRIVFKYHHAAEAIFKCTK